jgi:hypothetical protein
MDYPNAFIGKTAHPTTAELTATLGKTNELWDELVDWLAQEHGVTDREWTCSGAKYGWALRLKLKKRAILYLGPCDGCFRAALVLGDRAIQAAREGSLSKSLQKLIDEAPRYPEGTGVRIMVKRKADLAAVRELAVIKLAN